MTPKSAEANGRAAWLRTAEAASTAPYGDLMSWPDGVLRYWTPEEFSTLCLFLAAMSRKERLEIGVRDE